MIRLATIEDIPELQRMCRNFFTVTGYSILSSYDEESMNGVFLSLIENKTLFTDGKHGVLGFLIFPLFFNQKDLVAQELFWWVDEEKRGSTVGIRLLKKAEKQAISMGAGAFLMLGIEGLKSPGKLYERLGYRPQEHSYIKVI